jgi:hypothetical protein
MMALSFTAVPTSPINRPGTVSVLTHEQVLKALLVKFEHLQRFGTAITNS